MSGAVTRWTDETGAVHLRFSCPTRRGTFAQEDILTRPRADAKLAHLARSGFGVVLEKGGALETLSEAHA